MKSSQPIIPMISTATLPVQSISRRLVFISHANPQDNEFTLWLASRLACHGYLVWSDVSNLLGGETFWDDIEDAIRFHAAKTVVVLSRVAQTKQGVLDEVNVAVTTERNTNLGLTDFVIPLRIDDLPHNEIKANLARKNVIDFRTCWATGLKQLLEVLERDQVPTGNVPSAAETTAWFQRVTNSRSIVAESESLMTNWLEVDALPQNLYFHRVPIPDNRVRDTFSDFAFPVYPYAGLVATFASDEELNDGLPSWQKAMPSKTVSVEAIMSDSPHSMPTLQWREASNLLHTLLRTAWDKTMQSRGLHRYELSSGRLAWFPMQEHTEGNWVRYVDIHGKARRKQLVGHSAKRAVYWHFAVEAVPSIGHQSRLSLKPHVVFTEDGITPIDAVSKMQRLRRGFCRSWWNARWRDLLLAYVTMITDSSGAIALEVGDGQAFEMKTRPLVLTAPFRLADEDEGEEVEETDDFLDALADEDDQFPIDFGEGDESEVDEEEDDLAEDKS